MEINLQMAVASGRPFKSRSWKIRGNIEPWVQKDILSRKFRFVNGEQDLWHPEFADFNRNDFELMPLTHFEILEALVNVHPGSVAKIEDLQAKAKEWLSNQMPF